MQTTGFFSKLSKIWTDFHQDDKRCLLDRKSIISLTEFVLSVQSMDVLSNESSHNFFRMLNVIPFPLLWFSKMAAVWAKKFQKIQPEADIQCGKLQSKYEKVISN